MCDHWVPDRNHVRLIPPRPRPSWGTRRALTRRRPRIYGITVLQTYLYFRRYPKEGTALKSLVNRTVSRSSQVYRALTGRILPGRRFVVRTGRVWLRRRACLRGRYGRALDTLTIALISHAIYNLFVLNLGHLADDVELPW